MKLIIYSSDRAGNKANCIYPYRHEATDAASLSDAVRCDHVCAQYRENYRSNDNYIISNCVVMDVDNDHTEDPSEWITPESLAEEYADIQFAITYSRNHMKQKESYSPRPRFHIYFEIDPVTDADAYAEIKTALQIMYPFYDDNALDAGRFIFGADPGDVIWHDGKKTILSILESDDITPLIPEGNRNKTMYLWAVRYLKREGNTEESEKAFFREAEKCNPPLDDKELSTIWRSAVRFYEKKVLTDPAYVSPQEYKTGIPDKWEEPIPFGKYTTAAFPVDALPEDIAAFVTAVAESTQTPVDMAGTMAISILSLCEQGKFLIQGKADWFEPLNTYAINIALPSDRKSAVSHMMLRPVNRFEEQYNQRNAANVEASKMRKRVLERRQKYVEDLVSKGKAEASEMEQIAKEIADFTEERPLQLYVDDITTEKLVSVLAANRGRAALISSEGGIFDTLAGIYTKNVNIDVMLKGYSGDPIRVDRIGRESESITNPALTIHLMAQPNVVSAVLGNTTFRGRGLTARFLYCMPPSQVGSRKFTSESVPEDVYGRYEQRIVNLLEDDYRGDPEIITLSPEAYRLLEAFAEELEPKLRTEYAAMSDWAGKLVGNTLRIAGLLCRASTVRGYDFLDDPEPLVVGGKTMENAIRLGRYYLNHAQAAYDALPEDGTYKQAGVILTMLTEKNLTQFDRRQAMRLCRGFKTVAEIQPVLDFLEDYGYIFQVPQKPTGAGRQPLPKYVVNPRMKDVFCPFVRELSQEKRQQTDVLKH